MITAALVKELRERTGSGMMECKKALTEVGGDIEAAITAMRKSGQAKAAKKAGRIASEGRVAIKISTDGKKAVMAEVNCETDFVARDAGFLTFVDQVVTDALNGTQTDSQLREDLVAKIGENITIRRTKLLETNGSIGSYVHNNKIGVLVEFSSMCPNDVAKDIAMHIAANKPIAVRAEELPQELLDKEKEICLAQVAESGKPAEILEKMVTGRMQKFISELTLLTQPFVKDPNIIVAALLKQNGVDVVSFTRFEVGEGIEKKENDFAAEVASLIG